MNPPLCLSPWASYSEPFIHKILHPNNCGKISSRGAKNMRLVMGEAENENCKACLYLLIDETDGVITDAKFEAFGKSAFVGALEIACDLILQKNYDKAARISLEMIDHAARNRFQESAFPKDVYDHIHLAIDAVQCAAKRCIDIPIIDVVYPSANFPEKISGEGHPGWEILSTEDKIAIIKEVLAKEIQPFVELDGGGIEVIKLVNDHELVIAYQGACQTCPSAIGGTLQSIEQILRAKVSPNLIVIPDQSFLMLST